MMEDEPSSYSTKRWEPTALLRADYDTISGGDWLQWLVTESGLLMGAGSGLSMRSGLGLSV